MKKSTIMHGVSIVFGIWGGLALVGAWVFPSQQHLYNDAIVLTLIGISAGICTQIYLKQDK